MLIHSRLRKMVTIITVTLIGYTSTTHHSPRLHAPSSSALSSKALGLPALTVPDHLLHASHAFPSDISPSILKPRSFMVATADSSCATLAKIAPTNFSRATDTVPGFSALAPQATSQKIIILDLNNFITENTSIIMNKIGYSSLAGYMFTHWRSPINCCIETLAKMGEDTRHASETELLYKNKRMPHCVVSWQQGTCSYEEVKKALFDYIEHIDKVNFFKSAQEKELAQTIISMVLDPAELHAITKPVSAMIQLTQELKNKGFGVYAIANLAHEAYTQVKKAYPDIINLFDGVMVSSHAQVLKNDKRLLEKLLATYNLKAEQCMLIDQDKKTLETAEQLGIPTVPFTQQKNLRAQLKKQGIL